MVIHNAVVFGRGPPRGSRRELTPNPARPSGVSFRGGNVERSGSLLNSRWPAGNSWSNSLAHDAWTRTNSPQRATKVVPVTTRTPGSSRHVVTLKLLTDP